MRKLLLSLTLGLSAMTLFGQELPNVIPPSPETASLGKFTDVPVSYYTGLPNISVPIASYNLDEKDFSVSLNYHARGIKVEEISSRVGIGWALNAGGAIHRQVRDYADDGYLGLLSEGNILTSYLTSGDFFGTDNTARNTYYSRLTAHGLSGAGGQSSSAEVSGVSYQINSSSEGAHHSTRIDRIPDVFTISAGGLSAKFFINYVDGLPILQTLQDIKITFTRDIDGRIDSFKVIDQSGFTYYFGVSKEDDLGQTRNARNRREPIATISVPDATFNVAAGVTPNLIEPDAYNVGVYNTWHLLDIESPKGNMVNYFYDYNFNDNIAIPQEQHVTISRQREEYRCNTYDFAYFDKSRNYESVLSKIQFDRGSILFEKSNITRLDKEGSSALGKIIIRDINNDTIKQYQLNHSFKFNNDTQNVNTYFKYGYLEHANRMFLDSVTQIGNDGGSLPPYEFIYNNQLLPNRLSTAQDYWGYYNGADNGELLSWFQPFCNSVNYSSCGKFLLYRYDPTSDRIVDLEKSQAGMLEEIIYPTGGKSKFIYEHNIGRMGDEYDNIMLPEINPIQRRDTAISHFDYNIYDGDKYTKNIKINNISGNLKINVSLPPTDVDQNWACGNPLQNDCAFEMSLIGLNGAPSYHYIFAGQQELEVVSGEYRMIFNPKGFLNWDANPPTDGSIMENVFLFSLTWYEQSHDQSEYLFAGGKRIKAIEYYDNDDTLEYTKSFSYEDENGLPSGEILGLSSYMEKSQYTNYYIDFFNLNTNIFDFSHNLGTFPGGSSSTYQANSIGYRRVTEYLNEGKKAGKTVYEFTTDKDSGGDYLKYPYHPPVDNEWLRGLPISTQYYKYKERTAGYEIVKRVDNKYRYADYELPNALTLLDSYRVDYQSGIPLDSLQKVGIPDTAYSGHYSRNRTLYRMPLIQAYSDYTDYFENYDSETFCPPRPQEFFDNVLKYKLYFVAGGTLNLEHTTETNYFDGNVQLSTTEYFYDYPNHYQLKSTETVDSKGDLYKSVNEFSPELVGENRMIPVTTTSFKGNEKLSTQHTEYDDFGGVQLPAVVQTSRGNHPLEDRVVYHNYDQKGNPTKVSKKDGTVVQYIWGYNKTQPIAKIEGEKCPRVYQPEKRRYIIDCSRTTAQTTAINDAIIASNEDVNDTSEEALRTALTTLRNVFPDAFVTTITYDPSIGVTSITDPRGETMYYKYDEFNRLELVKDAQGNILKENKYNYKN